MHASVVIQDASMTTYTIFCAEEQPECAMSADAPFVFTEGPKTFKYTAVAEPTLYVEFFFCLLCLSPHVSSPAPYYCYNISIKQ